MSGIDLPPPALVDDDRRGAVAPVEDAGVGVGPASAKVIDLGIPDEGADWFTASVRPDTVTVLVLASDIDQRALGAEVDRFPNVGVVHTTIRSDASAERRSAFDDRAPSACETAMRSSSDSDVEAMMGAATLERTRPDRRLVPSPITIIVESGGDARVVRIAGELDIGGADWVLRRCTEDRTQHVVVDLADLTFLDCGGYRAFVAARTALARRHRTLTLDGAVGEPRRLLELISHLDLGGSSC